MGLLLTAASYTSLLKFWQVVILPQEVEGSVISEALTESFEVALQLSSEERAKILASFVKVLCLNDSTRYEEQLQRVWNPE